LYGRYNSRESAHKNINLPAALLSRFDLIFILLDKADAIADRELASHIGKVHQTNRAPEQESFFEPSFVRHFISLSRTFNPWISE
jgi:DNA replication licensing factor MCM7